jgi:hypothetical protein
LDHPQLQGIDQSLRNRNTLIEEFLEKAQSALEGLGAGGRSFESRLELSDKHLPFGDAMMQFLCQTIAILREDRGLLMDDNSPVTIVTLDSVVDRLFAAKNSAVGQIRLRFARVHAAMLGLLKLEMDVVVQYTVNDEDKKEEVRLIVFSQEGSDPPSQTMQSLQYSVRKVKGKTQVQVSSQKRLGDCL